MVIDILMSWIYSSFFIMVIYILYALYLYFIILELLLNYMCCICFVSIMTNILYIISG